MCSSTLFLHRTGSLFDTEFLKKMQLAAKTLKLSNRLESLLITMVTESLCELSSSVDVPNRDKKIYRQKDEPIAKRMRLEDCGTGIDLPPFYYFVHKLRLKNVEIPK
jgi:hypothetical protein